MTRMVGTIGFVQGFDLSANPAKGARIMPVGAPGHTISSGWWLVPSVVLGTAIWASVISAVLA
jgi:hypothetical protein